MSTLSSAELVQKCLQENALRTKSGTHCFELFCRALSNQDAEAWELIYPIYKGQIAWWVDGGPEGIEDRVHEVFARFLQSLGKIAGGESFVQKFPNMGALMQYLKCTTQSVRFDEYRRERKSQTLQRLDEMDEYFSPVSIQDSLTLEEQMDARSLYQHIRGSLKDEQERLYFKLKYVDGLTPREMLAGYPQQFSTVDEIYRIADIVQKRLKHDPRLNAWRASEVESKSVQEKR
jgi:DNA-directed RNA polymerase specialized sigma24 family protein